MISISPLYNVQRFDPATPLWAIDFHDVLSWASSEVIRSSCIMSLRRQSIHLPLGLLLGLFPGTIMSTIALTSLFSSILCICPHRYLHLPHAALTLVLTASSDPPSSLMVTPKYLNLFTCLRLVPRLSLLFAFVPLLPLTITFVLPVLTFSPLLSIPICQPSNLLCISSVSVTTASF